MSGHNAVNAAVDIVAAPLSAVPDPWHTELQFPAMLPAVPGAMLTAREVEVLLWLVEGKSDWEIGAILSISPKTVNYHVERAKRKLGATTRLNAVVTAFRRGVVIVLCAIASPAFALIGHAGNGLMAA